MPQELKESMRTTSHQVEIINRDRIKRNSGAEKYNIWNERRFELEEKRINELEDSSRRELRNRGKKMNTASETCGMHSSVPTYK